MYKISAKGQYALLIMEDLAEDENQKFIPLKTLAHRRNLSLKYLEQILIQLGKAGLVVGFRGNSGGYKLTRTAGEYTVGEILHAIEGDTCPQAALENNTVISEGSKMFWKNFTETVNNYLQSVTLRELVAKNKAFVGYEYTI